MEHTTIGKEKSTMTYPDDISGVIRICHEGLPPWHIKIWYVMRTTSLATTNDTQWHMQWHMLMTCPHDRYLNDISHDIWFWFDTAGTPTHYISKTVKIICHGICHDDICHEICHRDMSWRICHAIGHRDMSWQHMSCDVSSWYVMRYVIITCHERYVIIAPL